MSHEQILSPEAVLEGKAGKTRKQQHTGRPVQEATGRTSCHYLHRDLHFHLHPKASVNLCFSSLSMRQNWSRSRMSQRTRSSWEMWSNTAMSSRYSPSLQQTPAAPGRLKPLFLFSCLLRLCVAVIQSLPPQAALPKASVVVFVFTDCQTLVLGS